MAKKNKAPANDHKPILEANGLKPYLWEVEQELPDSLIVRHKITGEIKLIGKEAAKV